MQVFSKRSIASALMTVLCFHVLAQKPKAQKLWYKKPATQWVEALPVGYGHIGAMVF